MKLTKPLIVNLSAKWFVKEKIRHKTRSEMDKRVKAVLFSLNNTIFSSLVKLDIFHRKPELPSTIWFEVLMIICRSPKQAKDNSIVEKMLLI